MRPLIELDRETVIGNARAWQAFCAPAAFYAVVKADAYGWGLGRVVPLIEAFADAFCVSDADELRELRKYTSKRAIIIGRVPLRELDAVLRMNALASIETAEELEIAARTGTVRIGVRAAAAWSGLSAGGLREFAPALAACGAAVNLWTHLTDLAVMDEQVRAFETAHALLARAGVRVAHTDIASTFPLAAGCRAGSAVRVGIGLFGATGGPPVAGVRCALHVVAPVVSLEEHPAGTRVAYGGTMLSMTERIATARCGYADGLPKTLPPADDILSVGMQYLTVRASRLDAQKSHVIVMDRSTDLDAFSLSAGRLPHEIVTALGTNAA